MILTVIFLYNILKILYLKKCFFDHFFRYNIFKILYLKNASLIIFNVYV